VLDDRGARTGAPGDVEAVGELAAAAEVVEQRVPVAPVSRPEVERPPGSPDRERPRM